MEASVTQARWILVPLFSLCFVFLAAGALIR